MKKHEKTWKIQQICVFSGLKIYVGPPKKKIKDFFFTNPTEFDSYAHILHEER